MAYPRFIVGPDGRVQDTFDNPYQYPVTPYQTPQYENPSIGGATSTLGNAGLRGFFSKYFNKPGSSQPLFKGNVNLPSLKALRSQPLFEGGPSVGGLATTGMGLYQGANALKGLYDNSNKDTTLESLKNDISSSIASNPMYDMYLDASDERTIRELQNGNLTNSWGGAAEGAIKGVPKALISALIGGIAGGAPGAIINGVGSLGNSAIQGYGNKSDETAGKLQGLYSRLKQADSDYRTMKRPRGLNRAGLSTQYFNQLY